jgi:hypothetical protein
VWSQILFSVVIKTTQVVVSTIFWEHIVYVISDKRNRKVSKLQN